MINLRTSEDCEDMLSTYSAEDIRALIESNAFHLPLSEALKKYLALRITEGE